MGKHEMPSTNDIQPASRLNELKGRFAPLADDELARLIENHPDVELLVELLRRAIGA